MESHLSLQGHGKTSEVKGCGNSSQPKAHQSLALRTQGLWDSVSSSLSLGKDDTQTVPYSTEHACVTGIQFINLHHVILGQAKPL